MIGEPVGGGLVPPEMNDWLQALLADERVNPADEVGPLGSHDFGDLPDHGGLGAIDAVFEIDVGGENLQHLLSRRPQFAAALVAGVKLQKHSE